MPRPPAVRRRPSRQVLKIHTLSDRAADLPAGFGDVDGDAFSVANLTATDGTLADDNDKGRIGDWRMDDVDLRLDDGQNAIMPATVRKTAPYDAINRAEVAGIMAG